MKTAHDKILAGLEDAIAYMQGDDTRDRVAFSYARQVREATGMTAADFAAAYRLPPDTLQAWESGCALPDAGATTLLRLISHAPQKVRDLLDEAEA